MKPVCIVFPCILKPVWNLYVLYSNLYGTWKYCLVLYYLVWPLIFCLALICLDFVYLIKEEFCMHKLFWHKYCHLSSFRWLARKPRRTLHWCQKWDNGWRGYYSARRSYSSSWLRRYAASQDEFAFTDKICCWRWFYVVADQIRNVHTAGRHCRTPAGEGTSFPPWGRAFSCRLPTRVTGDGWTIVQWPGACDSTMRQTENELEWQYKLQTQKPRGQESSWPTLQELCACSPTRPILLGPSNSGRKFYEGNSSREFVPRQCSFDWCERCLETIDEALRIANQQETVEIAQKRLHKEKHLTSEALALETDVERFQQGVATQPSANTTRHWQKLWDRRTYHSSEVPH